MFDINNLMPGSNKRSYVLKQNLQLKAAGLFTVPHPDVFWYRLNDMDAQKISPKQF